jgi:hypothetical protein
VSRILREPTPYLYVAQELPGTSASSSDLIGQYKSKSSVHVAFTFVNDELNGHGYELKYIKRNHNIPYSMASSIASDISARHIGIAPPGAPIVHGTFKVNNTDRALCWLLGSLADESRGHGRSCRARKPVGRCFFRRPRRCVSPTKLNEKH